MNKELLSEHIDDPTAIPITELNGIKIDVEKGLVVNDRGSKRFSKQGKGAYHLIPGDIIAKLVENALQYLYAGDDKIKGNLTMIQNVLIFAYTGNYESAISMMIRIQYYWNYRPDVDIETTPFNEFNNPESPNYIQPKEMIREFLKMTDTLAKHYQNGAEIYGENNWCGLSLWTFQDSGKRHMTEWLQGMTDENHYIAAIWNFIGALYVKSQKCSSTGQCIPGFNCDGHCEKCQDYKK